MTDTTKKTRRRKAPGPFPPELLDQLLSQVSGKDGESLLGESGLVGQLKKQLAGRLLSAELKTIYRAADATAAEAALGAFEPGPWGGKFPPVAAWRRQWTQVIPFFAYPAVVAHDGDEPRPLPFG